jgi:hypothetical protein
MLHVVLTTKNKSIYVKTLHTLLGIESICSQMNIPLDITFTTDDTVSKINTFKRSLKGADRIVWFEYGVSIDRASIPSMVMKYEGFEGLIMPCVREGINWDTFIRKCKSGSNEPSRQMGLDFDVDVSSKVVEKERNFHEVTRTHSPSCWIMDCKRVMKKLKDKKKEFVFPSDIDSFFAKCLARNVKLAASVNSITYNHFTHECVGNIMNMSGLKVTG